MKKNLLTLAAVLTVAFFTNDANAQTSATAKSANATAAAKLIKPMTLEQDADLNFGTINVGTGAPGTVTLSTEGITAGTNIYDGGVAPGFIAGTVSNAAYTVGGTKNATYTVSLPTTVTVTEGVSGAGEMTITGFTVRCSNGTVVGKLSDVGVDTFKVGATLNVAANQSTGVYSGSFDVSVDYN